MPYTGEAAATDGGDRPALRCKGQGSQATKREDFLKEHSLSTDLLTEDLLCGSQYSKYRGDMTVNPQQPFQTVIMEQGQSRVG